MLVGYKIHYSHIYPSRYFWHAVHSKIPAMINMKLKDSVIC